MMEVLLQVGQRPQAVGRLPRSQGLPLREQVLLQALGEANDGRGRGVEGDGGLVVLEGWLLLLLLIWLLLTWLVLIWFLLIWLLLI